MTNQIQLTTKKSSYVHSLSEYKTEINLKYENTSVSVQQLKQFVRDIIINTNNKTLENKSQSTKKFLMSLEKQTSKTGILQLVWNSMLNGDGLGVIK